MLSMTYFSSVPSQKLWRFHRQNVQYYHWCEEFPTSIWGRCVRAIYPPSRIGFRPKYIFCGVKPGNPRKKDINSWNIMSDKPLSKRKSPSKGISLLDNASASNSISPRVNCPRKLYQLWIMGVKSEIASPPNPSIQDKIICWMDELSYNPPSQSLRKTNFAASIMCGSSLLRGPQICKVVNAVSLPMDLPTDFIFSSSRMDVLASWDI